MTAKRFTIEPTITRECIVDNTTGEQLDTFDYTERLCEVLNALHEERNYFERKKEEFLSKWSIAHTENIQLRQKNEQLKKAEILANHRGDMVSFANSLIDDLGSETMKEMWDKFREEKYEDWRKLE